ncbi:SDR family oxidoreductase [Streptomyces sp. NPDC026672]|uniref:SDR family NAD(P)-dependent oxidoreductase n=1 Tax=Actinomycetes TaxID=1760 RepID=UPI0033D87292
MSKLNGKIAVVTGATSGMGLATARLLASEGAHVYITGRRKDQLDQAVRAVEEAAPGRVTGVQADSGSPEDIAALFGTVGAAHGHVDIVYASAGIGSLTEPLEAVTTTSFDNVFAVNVRGTLLTVQHALPLMAAGGSVVINGSAGAVKGVPGSTVYAASKAALRSFVRTWTAELAGRGIRVNLLSPGPIDTATFDAIPVDIRDQVASMVPAGRFGTSEEIATAVLFLASDDSSFVHGTELAVDGGLAQI